MHLMQEFLRQQSRHTHSEGTFGYLALLEIVSLTPILTQTVSLEHGTSVEIVPFDITLPHLATEKCRSSDKQIYRTLVRKKCSCRCARITDVWEVQLLLCSFLTSTQNGRNRQLHITAPCLLKQPLIVTTKQESG